MTSRERLRRTLRGESVDRLPRIEWATWWDKTIARWEGEGLPAGLDNTALKEYFGLDVDLQFWLRPMQNNPCEITDLASYQLAKEKYWHDPIPDLLPALRAAAKRQAQGDIVWLTLEGFFWFPRRMFGIERHLYAFYDQPELMHSMNQDALAFNLQVLKAFCEILTPDFITFAEDMSYNNGPMLSKQSFETFLLPYYQQILPEIKAHGIPSIVDTDGDLSSMVPWLIQAGLDGALPLERQAGVDLVSLQAQYKGFCWIGGFDKMSMFAEDAETAMRWEFERLLPVMRVGGFVPSVDHQTPPQVSLANYRIYLKLLWEYTEKAAHS